MKDPIITYDYNQYWQSIETICSITGASKDSLIELYRKSRNGQERTPLLFSRWAPNLEEVKSLGKGSVRNYYFTDLLFISLNEQFKSHRISKDILSLFYVYFTYFIENSPSKEIRKLAEKNQIVSMPGFKHCQPYLGKDKKSDMEVEVANWKFSISSDIDGNKYGFITVDLEVGGSNKRSRISENKFHVVFSIEEGLLHLEKYQTKTSPPFTVIEKSLDSFACNIDFNLSTLHNNLVENICNLNLNG